MLTTTVLSSSLLALAATVQSFKFTGPSASEPLDLSKEIIITWSQGNSSEQNKLPPTFSLDWDSKPDELHNFGVELEPSFNASAGQYKWTPGEYTFKTLKPYAENLAKEKRFWFKAYFRNESDVGDVLYEATSEKYTITGLEGVVTNGGKTVGFEWGVLACGLATVGLML
ncbi:hypothetical protein FIE12Z_1513 [Fusarium flagelliforme]|uniref:Uncharacterized protein n=1 Tax=Fusarium flagelliforme TaxID=2675880 RepID=A0A395N2N4_9HYPO|nr:hypothetical protein FIE12Z_1513 [Fusarium flagelliforme]